MTLAAHMEAIFREFEYDLNLLLDRINRPDAHLVVQPASLRRGWRIMDAANDYEVMLVCENFRQVCDWTEAFLRQTPGAQIDSTSFALAWKSAYLEEREDWHSAKAPGLHVVPETAA